MRAHMYTYNIMKVVMRKKMKLAAGKTGQVVK
jgi:hypothetical protein